MAMKSIYGFMRHRATTVLGYGLLPSWWRFYAKVARSHGANVTSIAARAVKLYMVAHYPPEEAAIRGLLDPSEAFDEHRFQIAMNRLHGFEYRLNPIGRDACRDKVLFHNHCVANDLPCTHLAGVMIPPLGWTAGEDAISSPEGWCDFFEKHAPDEFVVKPADGNKGKRVMAFRREADGLVELGKGKEPLSAADLYAKLAGPPATKWVIERKLPPHPEIKAMTGSDAVCTARIITLVRPDGTPDVLDSYFRIVVGETVTDNISDGDTGHVTRNIVASPDLDSGELARAWTVLPDETGIAAAESHPVTSEPVAGFRIPHWQEACELVRRAAIRFLPLRTVGWDVAITPSGPVLIEGNELYQNYGRGPNTAALHKALQDAVHRPFAPVSAAPSSPAPCA